jgi:uncharacterized protein YfaS (alpha-2-macroglobulin family)
MGDTPDAEPASLTSGYRPVEGSPFFLLSDSGFTSQDNARVRVEGDPYAFEQYGGVDVVLYRVPNPLEFLKGQKDLHRIQVNGDYAGEGLANTLSFLWDKWFKKSRMVFQQIFTADARSSVVNIAPQMRQAPASSIHTTFQAMPQYRVLKQFQLVDRFRYPIQEAKPIAPPADTRIEGSSSNFIAPQNGDVYVPLGKLAPGLYFVEAYVGSHRATTLVFVADTVAISKTAGKSMLVWTADRASGKPVPNVDIVWSDGNGVLKSDHTDDDGIASFARDVPEKTYTLGQDKGGGVFVSENFYYDSEIYNSKLYLFTDRPLYKPGDRVKLKVYGREFTGARASKPIEAARVEVKLIDPSGQALLSRSLQLTPDTGGDGELTLPANAYPGGYELRFDYRDATYSAMFRVADYAKPAFDVAIRLDRDDVPVGEPVSGQVELHYPDGTPVTDASVSLDLKAQALSIVNGDPEYGARFPQKLAQSELTVNARGIARFTLPAAAIPSRYLLQAVAREHNIFPVSANRELILQPAQPNFALAATQAGIAAGKPVSFALTQPGAQAAPAPQAAPSSWQAIRLEDRSVLRGTLPAGKSSFDITFPNPGAYNVFVRGQNGVLLAQADYSIARPETKALAGAIFIRLDKPRYRPGEVAHVQIVFPEPVDNALLTLERDQVEARSLLSRKDGWLTLTRKGPAEWQADIPVKEEYGPNMTFSALYVKNGDFNFQNAGIQVVVPALDIAIHTDKSDYRPGDKVTVDLTSTLEGKPAAVVLSAGVVDDMVYTLQPEVAPSIFDFFYHPRRDSVRTTASLNFYGYDLAWSPNAGSNAKFDYNQRALKVLTRPRRENIDTAAWKPTLKTDAQGHVSFSFVMPDSLSRWRITVRAANTEGAVGQRTASITSSKPVYMRWTGPTTFRQGDTPRVGLIVFNEGRTPIAATLKADGSGLVVDRSLKLAPGGNFVDLPFTANFDSHVDLKLNADGKLIDRLRVPIAVDAAGWTSARSQLAQAGDTLNLPADAQNIRVQGASSTAQAFGGVIDDLIDYPFGGVEQTASRMIPLTMALDSLPEDTPDRALRDNLQLRLQTSRGRLMAMAGPKADFAWWGDQTEGDLLLTTYAYYADWRATQRLGIDLPPEHWQHVFDTYQAGAADAPLVQRALALWLMQDMHLPVRTLLQGLQADIQKAGEPKADASDLAPDASLFFSFGNTRREWQMTLLLWRDLVRRDHANADAALGAQADRAGRDMQASANPVLAALAAGLSGKAPDAAQIAALVNRLDDSTPTMERALALVWLQAGVKSGASDKGAIRAGAGWRGRPSAGGGYWAWTGGTAADPLPKTLDFKLPAGSTEALRVSYRSAAPEAPSLPLNVTRRLYRLVPTAKPGVFNISRVQGALAVNGLYVDEVSLTPGNDNQVMRYGQLEVPLPTGAVVEAQRFGFQIDGLDPLSGDEEEGGDDAEGPIDENGDPLLSTTAVLSTDKIQEHSGSYTVPIEALQGPQVVRHLIRMGQPGSFAVPAARYFRTYDPSAKAIDTAAKTTWTVQ